MHSVCILSMSLSTSTNLENSAVATGLEKVHFHITNCQLDIFTRMSQRHVTLNIATYKFSIFPACSVPTSDFIFSLNDKWHFVNPSIQTLGRHAWNIIHRLINLTSESTSLHLYCYFSDPRQYHLLSGLLSLAMNWGSFLLFRIGIYGSSWPRLSWWCDYSPRARHPGMWSQVGLRKTLQTKFLEVMEFQLSYFKS